MRVLYIRTWTTSLLHRQVVTLPGRQAAGERINLGETPLVQQKRRLERTVAAATTENNRALPVLLEFTHARRQVRQRNVQRVDDVAAGKFLRLAHVHHDAVLAVHYLDGLGRRKTADTGQPLAQRRGHQQGQHHPEGEKQIPVINDELYGHG